MAFMELYIYPKAPLHAAHCAHCGATIYAHEANDVTVEDLRAAAARCDQCVVGFSDPETVEYQGKQYAGRYSANGYLDCTEWQFNANRRTLEQDLRAQYGDDD